MKVGVSSKIRKKIWQKNADHNFSIDGNCMILIFLTTRSKYCPRSFNIAQNLFSEHIEFRAQQTFSIKNVDNI